MASQSPALVRNQNFYIHRGKAVNWAKNEGPKPTKTQHRDRKALRDLSNTGKPPISAASKGSVLKQKSSTVDVRETPKNASRITVLTDEETKSHLESDKEKIERVHFTGNDLQKLHRDLQGERVGKKVSKVMSTLHEWSSMPYDVELPMKKISQDEKSATKMGYEPEELPPITELFPTSARTELEDFLFESDLEYSVPAIELKLKEDYNSASKEIGGASSR